MCQFIETIRIENGLVCNLSYHQERMDCTAMHFWHRSQLCQLAEALADAPVAKDNLIKARLVYDERGIIEKTYAPYTMREIHSMKMVENDDICYSFKSTNRQALAVLSARRGMADEVIIVKNGLITDSSYSNLAFFDGSRWLTPATPLLNGTMRQMLIDSNQLFTAYITPADIHRFSHVSLINAMLPLGRCVVSLDDVQP